MDNNGVNHPLALLTFFAGAGASVGGILFSLLVAILVPVVGKFVDGIIRARIAERRNGWRRRALEAEARARSAEERLREMDTEYAD